METNTNSYRGYRFPPVIIGHAVYLYHRFSLSFRDINGVRLQQCEEQMPSRAPIIQHPLR